MSASNDSQDWYRVQTWHRQSIDALTEDSSIMESLLEQAVKDTRELGKVPLLIKQRIWLADTQRMQGNYLQAISLYELLISLTVNPDFDYLFTDDKIVWCIAKAFLGFVESKRLSTDTSAKQLLLKLDEGLNWLKKIGKPDWTTGLLLQKGLLLKAQGKPNDACQAMKEALERKRINQEAPGYPLSTHQLEYADILCNVAIAEYPEAAAEAQKVLDTEGNSTYDRQWACQTLAYARMGNGEPEAALEALKQAQTLAYTLESADALTAMTQLLGRLPRQIERMVEDISKQTTQSINDQVPQLDAKQVQLPAPQHTLGEQTEVANAEQLKAIQNRLDAIEACLDTMRQIWSELQEEVARAVQLKGIEDHLNAIQGIIDKRKGFENNTLILLKDIQDRLSGIQKTLGDDQQTTDTQLDNSPKHIVCLVIFPVGTNQTFDYKNVLLPALRQVLEQRPYYWEVASANDKYYGDNVASSMKYAAACVVDISDQNPDMFVELGRIHGTRKDGYPLIIVLERGGIRHRLSLESDIIHISYSVVEGTHAVEDLAGALKAVFENGAIRNLDAKKEHHYLSPFPFKGVADDEVAKVLARQYRTMEAFVSAQSKDISHSLRKYGINMNTKLIDGYKKAISAILQDL